MVSSLFLVRDHAIHLVLLKKGLDTQRLLKKGLDTRDYVEGERVEGGRVVRTTG